MSVRRRGIACAVLWVGGCVATNPRWDGDEAGRDDDDGAASAADGGSEDAGDTDVETTAADEGSSGAAESSFTAGSDGDSSSSGAMASADDGDVPMCPGDDLACDGVCKNIQKDKHACGAECTDCEVLFDDSKATCVDGVCLDPDDNSGPGGDED